MIKITIEEVFLHCAKALMRSKLWQGESQITRGDFPSMGQMINDQLNDPREAESQQAMEARYLKTL